MSNDCHRFRGWVADFVTGVLPEPNGRELQEHLSTCVPCRDYLQALRQEDVSLAEYFAVLDETMGHRQERALQMIECFRTNERTNTISIWRRVMKNRYSTWATAAAVLLLAAVALIVSDQSTSPAYAITDLPQAFEEAGVIHVQGWSYFPAHRLRDGRRIPPLEIGTWIDLENNRSRHMGGGFSMDGQGNVTVIPCETISDGSYQMSINHGQKSARYYRLSPYHQRLALYRMSKLVSGQLFGRVERLADSVIVGHEFIEGTPHDIWQAEVPGATRTKHWLSTGTGRLTRAQALSRTDEGRWELDHDYQTIEYNVEIPENTFAMEPPEGYTTSNTKETADVLDIGSGGAACRSLWCSMVISFTLSDGSVILGWRSFDKESEQPPDLPYRNLTVGGALPKLPVEIHALKPAGNSGAVTYTGCHLAYTDKGDKFTEWSLYVPSEAPPTDVKELGYEALYRFNVDPQPPWIIHLTTDYGVPIETAEDFAAWVLGAMAELSETATAPDGINYQTVLDLVHRIRSSNGW